MKKRILLLCVLCLTILGILFVKNSQTTKFQSLLDPNKIGFDKRAEHSSNLFDPAFFDQAYSLGEQYKQVPNDRVFGGIIPHHLLASPLIAGFFEGIANQNITTIILLSPNHYGIGPYHITTSKGIWTTIFGDLKTDVSKVSQLENDKVAFVSEDLFDTEHGIYGITPFIKKAFPNAQIVPLVIKSSTSKQECDKLVQTLNNITDDHTLVLVSADFSHYLPSNEADQYDKKSISAIESFDIDKVFDLNNTKNVDSPESVYTLLKLMQLKKATNSIFLTNTNSAKLTDQLNLQSTTSYLTMYFTKRKNALSTDSIFQYIDPFSASIKNDAPEEYTIIATGDVIPARSVNSKLVQLNNFNYPYEKTVNFLKSADAVFVNLESPLLPKCEPTLEGMIFCGDQRNVQGLVYAGVTVANIANNHTGNYGIDGVNSTVDLLKKSGINVTGNGKPAIVTIRDKTVGFLGYNNIGGKEPGIAWADLPQVQQDIQKLKKQVDFVIVTFHWGTEYTSTPNTTQTELAHTAIDAGADLIIGNHPHWVQGVEQYKGKFITYAHGNYVFDQMWSQETREGVLGKYVFNNKELVRIEFVPIIIDNYSQPRFATKIEANKILSGMKTSSQQISSEKEY